MTLEKKYNIIYSRKRIQRIMKKFNIVCPIRKSNPYKRIAKATKEHTIVPNLLNRNFKQEIPGKVLLTDITYLPYGNNQMACILYLTCGSFQCQLNLFNTYIIIKLLKRALSYFKFSKLITLLRKVSKLHLPYIILLITLILFTLPSASPLLQSKEIAFFTASISCFNPLMKLLISLIPKFKESSIHKFNLFTSLFFYISLNLLTISKILLTYVYCLHNNSNKFLSRSSILYIG